MLTRPLDHRTLPAKLHPGNAKAQRILAEDMQGSAACFWATHCGRGCSIRANYQSTTVHLPPALATGNLDILANAMAREVTLDAAGRAAGVTYIDKTTGLEHHVAARSVVLAASACETVRILLNSKSSRFPDGLANSSGLVGNTSWTPSGRRSGEARSPSSRTFRPSTRTGRAATTSTRRGGSDKEQKAGRLGFTRGYHVEIGTGRAMPAGDGGCSRTPGAGPRWAGLKEDARRYYGSYVSLTGRGEMIPNADSFCEIDPRAVETGGASRSCASTGNGPPTKSGRSPTCSGPLPN